VTHPTIIHGDCITAMAAMPDNSVDAIVTDPPYGLGFMGKAWDALPPGEDWARECLRVLKPGGHLLAFGGTRTWHRLAVAVEDAGFEIRDSIAWMYGSGFPKHRAALKPAFEPIVMARKPFRGSLTANEAIHGTGALNIDGCRIDGEPWTAHRGTGLAKTKFFTDGETPVIYKEPHGGGRWPANVALDDDMAEVLDGQSGILTSGKMKAGTRRANVAGWAGAMPAETAAETIGDSGGASRFFYVAKAPKKERPIVDGIAHETVKPLALMRWLVRLVTPPGGVVLDPFAGSGTTLEACMLEGFDAIGIEREADYLPLIRARIDRQAGDVAA
jgi:site-specific DNA-methyltransferase (adenine-specific)